MTTLIKASRIAHLTDARYFAAKEVDYLGFNLEEGTEGYLDPMYMKAIREWVEGPKIVGEFSRTPVPVIREAAAFFGLDAVQVTAAQYGKQLSGLEGLEVLLEIEVGEKSLPYSVSQLQEFAAGADIFLFDFSQVKNLKSMLYDEKDYWREIFSLRPALIQGDLPAGDWPDILTALGPTGICFTGREEEKVGVKSYDEIEAIFEVLT